MVLVNSSADAYSVRLGDLVRREVGTLREFLKKLEQEQQALVSGTIELLPTLAQEKSALVAQLNQFLEQRHELLAGAMLPAGRAGMESWLATKTASETCLQEWQDLLQLVRQTREINEINGKLINTRLQHNQQILSALLEAANRATLYGPDGQTQAAPTGRLFGAV